MRCVCTCRYSEHPQSNALCLHLQIFRTPPDECTVFAPADIQNTPRRILTNVPAQHLYIRISQSAEETQRQVAMLRDISIKSMFIIANDENAKTFLEEVMYTAGQLKAKVPSMKRCCVF